MVRRLSDEDLDAFVASLAGQNFTFPRLGELLVQEFGYMAKSTVTSYLGFLVQRGDVVLIGFGWWRVRPKPAATVTVIP